MSYEAALLAPVSMAPVINHLAFNHNHTTHTVPRVTCAHQTSQDAALKGLLNIPATTPPESGPPAGGSTITRHVRRFLGLWKTQETVTESYSSSNRVEHTYALTRLLYVSKRRTTLRSGRVVEDTVKEAAIVQDHLGRLHSARISTYQDGQLVHEVAVLYLPAGLAGKALSGSLAASLAVGLSLPALSGGTTNGINGYRGSSSGGGSGAAAAAVESVACRAVGYTLSGGSMTWGLLKDPEALGLPRQRAVTRASLERVQPPPWQLLLPSQQGSARQSTAKKKPQQQPQPQNLQEQTPQQRREQP